MRIRIVDKTTNKIIFANAKEALGFFKRLRGLMFRKTMPSDEALIFYHTPSIHTFFMCFDIDIIFLDDNKRIMKIYKNLKPNKAIYCPNSYCAIECSGSSVSSKRIEVGHYIEFVEENSAG